jgi:DNA excision repair protein ERCC-4
MEIYVVADHREYKSQLPELLEKAENTTVAKAHLPLGDYLVNDCLLIERKTLKDLVASIKSGRLFTQMFQLAHSGKKCVLLLEGTTVDLTGRGMRREAIQGALIHITMRLEIPILRAKDAEESAKIIRYVAQQFDQIKTKKAMVKRYRPSRLKNKQKKQLYVLQGLPGVGPERANALLEKFGSVENIVKATEKELQTVPGIGKYTARQIRWVLEEPEILYKEKRPIS